MGYLIRNLWNLTEPFWIFIYEHQVWILLIVLAIGILIGLYQFFFYSRLNERHGDSKIESEEERIKRIEREKERIEREKERKAEIQKELAKGREGWNRTCYSCKYRGTPANDTNCGKCGKEFEELTFHNGQIVTRKQKKQNNQDICP
tara:strand:+ start:96 stop:536 length:441 start_codon:yes stop_codon:yes gene_type:complete